MNEIHENPDFESDAEKSIEEEDVTYGDIVWGQFKKNRVAYISLWGVAGLFILATFTPLLSSAEPFYWKTASGTTCPWFTTLFDTNYFENSVDIFFNLLMVLGMPMLLAWWLWMRSLHKKIRNKRPRRRLIKSVLFAGVMFFLFFFIGMVKTYVGIGADAPNLVLKALDFGFMSYLVYGVCAASLFLHATEREFLSRRVTLAILAGYLCGNALHVSASPYRVSSKLYWEYQSDLKAAQIAHDDALEAAEKARWHVGQSSFSPDEEAVLAKEICRVDKIGVGNFDSASKNEAAACRNLGTMHAFGYGVEKNQLLAKNLYEHACILGDGIACRNSGDVFLAEAIALHQKWEKTQAQEVKKELKEKVEEKNALYARSCELGDSLGCSRSREKESTFEFPENESPLKDSGSETIEFDRSKLPIGFDTGRSALLGGDGTMLFNNIWLQHLETTTALDLEAKRQALAKIEAQAISAVFTLAPYSYRQQDFPSLEKPTKSHIFGISKNGSDVATRILYGTRISLTIGFIAVAIYVTIGIILGSLAGYFGGKVDIMIQRLIEIVMCIPSFFLILTVIAMVGSASIFLIMCAIGFVRWTGVARLVRGEFLRLRNQDFVTSAKALGYPTRRIIFQHVLPNALGPVLVAAAFGVAQAILLESSLSFLGMGDASTASWGVTLREGHGSEGAWHLVLIPGAAIFLTVLLLNLAGEGVRDAMDPKLRK